MVSARSAAGCISIKGKIRTARDLFAQWGEDLQKDDRIRELVSELKEKIALSQQAMLECGLVEACRICEEEEGGSCCGKGIEEKFDPMLLLINLLMGRPLPEEPDQNDSCHFLGPQGCSLEVRHVICVNYVCQKLQNKIPLGKLIYLQTVTGEELGTLFQLSETIQRFMKHGKKN